MIKGAMVAACVLASGAMLISCESRQQEAGVPCTVPPPKPALSPLAPPSVAATQPSNYPGLHNVVAYDANIYSGAVPEGDEGFESLARLGIRTIIDVDGAAPQLQLGHKYNFRYVHLPVTYGGFSDEQRLEIARAVRDLPKPLYIHCHHGKHRSAAVAGATMVTLGEMTPEEAVARMKVSGTAPNYTGLYECVNLAKLASAAELDAAPHDFPEVFKTSGMVKSMVLIDDATDHLKQIQKAGWATPKDHPDLVPAAEAGRLADLLRVLHSDPEVADHPAELAEWFTSSQQQASKLEEQLVAGATPEQLTATFTAVTKSCVSCHAKYRD